MQIKSRSENNILILDISGEVDLYSSPEIRKKFNEITEKKVPLIIVNLSEVNYIDSSGVATLVEAFQKTRSYGGKLRLAAMKQNVKNVFEVARLDKIFDICGDLNEAITSFN
jgi:anti-sigma B factor antagonist